MQVTVFAVIAKTVSSMIELRVQQRLHFAQQMQTVLG